MADRKKPSGAQFRKRKAERAKEDAKQEAFFRKYLCKTSREQEDDSTICETTTEETASTSGIGLTTSGITSEDKVSQSGDIPVEHTEETEDFEETESTAITTKHVGIVPSLDYSDPANWPNCCSENLQQLIVQHGPRQIVSYKFPKDSQKRKLSPVYYKRKLVNGEEMPRHWLIYSTSKDVFFCFCCRLFSKRDGRATALEDPGSKDWKNIGAILSAHERSTLHIHCYHAWRDLELRLQKGKTTDNINQQKIKEEEQYWRQVLERLIATVRFLGMQNMAFRGTTEKLYSENNGNFLKLVEFLALFDPVMTEHVRRVKDEETKVHYLGKEIQNELIELLATSIKQNILARINSAKYYSVILDCTPDVSHTEQVTMIVRFVNVIIPSNTETSEPEVTIKEHFLGFVPLKKTTGAFMAETLLGLLEQMGLPLENLRGQGYDNGSNMRGKEHGVQKRVLDINPRAFFVPCSAHSLNLVVSDAAKSCREATDFFMLVQQIYNYFSASTQDWQILTSHVPTITATPLSQTRWESQIDALKPLRYHLGSIYDALMEIYNEPHPDKTSESLVTAKDLAEGISKFKFVVSLVVWYDMLFEINLTSKQLQNKETGLSSATSQLQVTKNYLVGSRCDDGFERVLIDATVIAKELEISPNFETEQFRQRRKKKQFGYEAPDETPQDPKQKFKVDFYYAILDMAIQCVEERFQQLQHYNSIFGFLYDIYSINKKCTEDVQKACKTLEQSLTHNENKDIDAEDLCCELQAVARRLPESMPPQKVLLFILQHKLQNIVPNVFVSLRILLTLPVSVASGECSFSKLKLIKTYIRSTMLQNRLDGLATISIEHAEASALDLKELLTKFAKEKARKIRF